MKQQIVDFEFSVHLVAEDEDGINQQHDEILDAILKLGAVDVRNLGDPAIYWNPENYGRE